MLHGKKTGKTPIVSTIIAAFCLIVYIAALSYAALMIFDSVNERRVIAEEEFDRITDLASYTGASGFMDESFIRTIQDAVENSFTLLGVIISGPNGEQSFERERGTVISWSNNSPRFKTGFGITYPPRHMPLRIEGQRNVNIQAVSGYIDYDQCVKILKQTLLAILAALALAFFTLLIETVLLKNRKPAARAAPAAPPVSPAAPPSPPPAQEEAIEDLVTGEDLFADVENSIKGETGKDRDEDLPGPALDPAEERLEDELRSSALAGNDLVYMVIGVKDSVLGEDSLYQAVTRTTLKFFSHRDLIFKKDGDRIAIICPDTGLNDGFAQSEDIYYHLRKGDVKGIPDDTDIRIGLSSRAERSIGAERLMFEAEEALRRAGEDPVSHIVAFKSDPEKYREFIQTKGLEAS
ncbi:MAG: hypothetical protein LBH26_03595 [Treponema sp.]|jgi:hypothetical protein|nr:hypothetical protein [Treponema sp.]